MNTTIRRVSAPVLAAFAIAAGAFAQPVINSEPPARRPAAAQPAGPVQLIPRAVLFGNPEKAAAAVSPDGSKVAFLAPLDGVLNVWVAPSGKIESAKAVTSDSGRGIRRYYWAYSNQHILYLQDSGGDEKWHVFSVDLATGKAIDLTPIDGVTARLTPDGVSPEFPDTVVIGFNDRDPRFHDLYRVNIRTGERTLMLQNDGYLSFTLDDDFNVRYAYKVLDDGSVQEFVGKSQDGKVAFEAGDTIPREDVDLFSHVGFDKTGNVRYIRDSRGRDTAALFAIDLGTGQKTILFQDDRTDADVALIHPTEKTVQAVRYNYLKPLWGLLDRGLERDWQFMRKSTGEGEVRITSRSLDDRLWTVEVAPDNASARTYLYDRGGSAAAGAEPVEPKMTLLFVSRPALQGLTLARMEPAVIRARDGLELVSYLTLPPGCDANNDKLPDKPVPMILNVHGGPWARDQWGYNAEHQWLANRGYAVLSVNFRGSTGFGKQFIQASKREWGGKMHDDLLDAVQWAVDSKIADPGRIAIYGGSYGGYATLVGLTFSPEVFACGVDIVGVSNLTTFMKTIPPYWKPMIERLYAMVGDDRTEEGRAFLLSRSPVAKIDQIKRPLLIAQGANDPRVNKDESDQVVNAMKARNIPVTYVVYPDEGHGFARPVNRMSFYAIAEAFLAAHLGGSDPAAAGLRFEPIGDAFKGSTLEVEAGAAEVPGLAEALDKK